jgi:Fur family ferric uptake transcriptional regulator
MSKTSKEILTILSESKRLLSYDQVLPKLEKKINKTTFYRTVQKLQSNNEINIVDISQKQYFEIRKRPHAHFVCQECRDIECLGDLDIKLDKNYIVNNAVFYGVCYQCQ